MIAVTFADRVHELSIPQAQALWVDGTIDRVRMDGEDYFMASDVALVLANQGLIHEDAFVAKAGVAKGGGQCGRGWVGVKGSCKRLAKGGGDRDSQHKAALGEFALGQRMKKFGIKAQSPQQKAVIEQGREMFGTKRRKSAPNRESKINQLRTKLEKKVQGSNDKAMAERMKNGKTAKYYKLSEASDTIASHTENPSMNPKVAAKQQERYLKRRKAFEKSMGMKGVSEDYDKSLKEKDAQAIKKSIDRKGYKNYKKSENGVRPDWSSASTLSRGRRTNGIRSKAQAEEASKNHYTKRRI